MNPKCQNGDKSCRTIFRQLGEVTGAGTWRHWRDERLPEGLLETAKSRFNKLLLFFILLWSLAALPRLTVCIFGGSLPAAFPNKITAHLYVFVPLAVVTVLLYLWSKRKETAPKLVADLALGYMVVLAFGLSLWRHGFPWTQTFPRDWSMIGVVILAFSALIPNTRRKTFLAVLITALMDPLGLWINVTVNDMPWPEPGSLGHLFGPTGVAVVFGLFISSVVFSMGREIQRARQMGAYKLVEPLGRGGMGEVWRAEHQRLARPSAVKLIPPELLAHGSAESALTIQRRFEREARATAMLESENTIQVYDFGVTDDGTLYYVMELLDGLDLEELVQKHGPLPAGRVVALLRQVCESLAEAHADGLVHRDIKPANIYLCRRGLRYDVVKVLDFGLVRQAENRDVKLTAADRIAGSPAFMAPEAATGLPTADHRLDIYSLGCVAYWLLTGKLVYEGDTPMQMLVAHASQQAPALSEHTELDVPAGLESLIHDCLQKNPDDRPASAGELGLRLGELAIPAWKSQQAEHWWRLHHPKTARHAPV